MGGVRSPDRLRSGLGEPEMANQSSRDQLGHSTDSLLDRRRLIDPVEVIEVDVIGAETRKAFLERRANLVTLAQTDAAATTELGREHHVGAMPGYRAAHHLFTVAGPIDIRCVDERDSELEGARNGRRRVGVVGVPVDARETHRAESDCRDHRSVRAEAAMLHGESSWVSG
jgi:hypothetical protein